MKGVLVCLCACLLACLLAACLLLACCLHADSTFPEPITTDYRGVTVYEVPPNGQGITALMALNNLEGFPVTDMGYDTADRVHVQVEVLTTTQARQHPLLCDCVVQVS
jgi:gamma-glutamyltranspeptidase